MMRFILFLLAAILIALTLFSCARTSEPIERTIPDFTDAGVSNLITKSRYQLLLVENCVSETVNPMRAYIYGYARHYSAPDPETGWTEDGIRTPDVAWNHFAGQAAMWSATEADVKEKFLAALRGFYKAVPPSTDASAGEIMIRGLNETGTAGYTSVTVSGYELMTMEGRPYIVYTVTLGTD
jgi:hypothetical protein